jgi:hypothetical protein
MPTLGMGSPRCAEAWLCPALPLPSHAAPLLGFAVAVHSRAVPRRCACHSIAVLCDALPRGTTPRLCVAKLCLCTAQPRAALPAQRNARPCFALAAQCSTTLCHCPATRRSAMPPPCGAPLCHSIAVRRIALQSQCLAQHRFALAFAVPRIATPIATRRVASHRQRLGKLRSASASRSSALRGQAQPLLCWALLCRW